MKKSDLSERKQSFVRLFIVVVLCVVGYFWGILAAILVVLNWLYALFFGVRNKFMAEFVELYASFVYDGLHYAGGSTNKRPFPFAAVKPKNTFE